MSEPEQRPEPREKDDAWRRRKRRAEIFGDALPDTTRDERDETAADRGQDRGQDRWLREQVPPHHGS